MHRRHKIWCQRFTFTLLTVAVFTGLSTACQPRQIRAAGSADTAFKPDDTPRQRVAAAFRSDVLSQIDQAVNGSIALGNIPGGVLWIEHNGIDFEGTYGYRALVPQRERMTRDTIFDIASLTKVLATTCIILGE
jgi:CubicO group peptidase (beta-lactamase class C family)